MTSTDPQHLYNKAWLFASHAHVGQTMKGYGSATQWHATKRFTLKALEGE